jgi:hypothetical protein
VKFYDRFIFPGVWSNPLIPQVLYRGADRLPELRGIAGAFHLILVAVDQSNLEAVFREHTSAGASVRKVPEMRRLTLLG